MGQKLGCKPIYQISYRLNSKFCFENLIQPKNTNIIMWYMCLQSLINFDIFKYLIIFKNKTS